MSSPSEWEARGFLAVWLMYPQFARPELKESLPTNDFLSLYESCRMLAIIRRNPILAPPTAQKGLYREEFFPSWCSQGFWDTVYHCKGHRRDCCAMRGILELKQSCDLAFQQTEAPLSLVIGKGPPSFETKGHFGWYCSCRLQWDEPIGMNGKHLDSFGKTWCS